MAKFDPFRQNMPPNPQPGQPYPAPGYPPPPGQYPPAPAPAYPAGYAQPGAYPPPQPAYGQPYAAPQQPAYPPQPQPAYPQQPGYYAPPPQAQPYPQPQPAYPQQPQPVAYGQPQYPPQNFPPNPYAPPQPAPVPVAYAPQPAYQQPQPVRAPQPMPVPAAAPDMPMSAWANPAAPLAPLAPLQPATVKPVAPKPVQVAPAAHTGAATQPRPVQPVALQPLAPKPAPVQPGAKPATGAAVRPVLAPVKPKDDKPKVDKETAEDAPPPDPTEKVIKGAPPWMISMVVHMVLLIVLALVTFASITKNQIFIQSDPVYAETLGEQVIEQELQSPEFENMEIENPALSFDVKPVDDPLAAPPITEMTSVDANVSVDTIEAPSIGMALNGREAGSKRALMAAYGGNATTEESVQAGLRWLKKNQHKDGGWSLKGPFNNDNITIFNDNRVSATAMALLAFQGNGHTHKSGEHKDVVANGWKYLKTLQNADGMWECDTSPHYRLYAQAQATIAACELFGMTKDEEFRTVAQKGLDFALFAQAPEGGWRYEPKQDSDTSVTGWFVMALQSGMMGGLNVPSTSTTDVGRFLDSVQENGGSHYGYKPGMPHTLTMTAEGLLCRMYLGWRHDDPRLIQGMDYVIAHPINYEDRNVYYWYYATQAAHHMGGHHWKTWNQAMMQAIPKAQVKTGAEAGSWSPSGDEWSVRGGGRLFTTCMSIYMLEAYYRHMPLYKHRIEMPKGAEAGAIKALNAASK